MRIPANLQWGFIQFTITAVLIAFWPDTNITGKTPAYWLLHLLGIFAFWIYVSCNNIKLPNIIGEKYE